MGECYRPELPWRNAGTSVALAAGFSGTGGVLCPLRRFGKRTSYAVISPAEKKRVQRHVRLYHVTRGYRNGREITTRGSSFRTHAVNHGPPRARLCKDVWVISGRTPGARMCMTGRSLVVDNDCQVRELCSRGTEDNDRPRFLFRDEKN